MTTNRLRAIALFPLCDVHSILLDALKTGDMSDSTRPDALVFAWLLELPKGIDAGDAARAILTVAQSQTGWPQRPYQRVLRRELAKLVQMVEEEDRPVDARFLAQGRWRSESQSRTAASIKASKRSKQRSLERFLLLKGANDSERDTLSVRERAERDRKIQSDRIKKARNRGLFNRHPDKPE